MRQAETITQRSLNATATLTGPQKKTATLYEPPRAEKEERRTKKHGGGARRKKQGGSGSGRKAASFGTSGAVTGVSVTSPAD